MTTTSNTSSATERRIIRLEGGRNFRDLGGYRTQDGRRVKWGRLFRSGSMSGLTPRDYDTLSQLSIKTICDLRTTPERDAEPNKWREVANINYWARDYGDSFGEIRKIIMAGVPSADTARTAMIAGYRRLPFEQAPSYKELFSRLAAADMPLVFNCSAGKDRAGTAAALILSALGVPRETVIEDYVLTNRVLDSDTFFTERRQRHPGSVATQTADIFAAIMNADAAYLQAALEAVDERHGSVAAYVVNELELSADDLRSIQQHLLE